MGRAHDLRVAARLELQRRLAPGPVQLLGELPPADGRHRERDIPADRQLLARIRGASAPAGMSTRIVAVDGPGGAGKSTLAAALAAELDAPVVHTDDFASWDNPLDWWPRAIHQVLEPLTRDL